MTAPAPAPPRAARPPTLVIVLIVLMLWQGYENVRSVRDTWNTVPGSNLLVILQVLTPVAAVMTVAPLWRRDPRVAPVFIAWCALLVAEATVAGTIFTVGEEQVAAGFWSFGASLLIMAAVAHFTVRWLRRGERG